MTSPLVFIDLSYYVFHRYYALQRWYKFSKQEPANEDEMIAKFTKLFEDNLCTFKRKLKCEWKDMYIVKDCLRENIWRMKHYADYKKNRDDKKGEFNPLVFNHTYNVILPSLVDKYKFNLVGYDTAEADDVVAVMHGMARAKWPSRQVVIITNDNDYLQLHDSHTLFYNCNNVDILQKVKDVLEVFIEWKVIKGDVSDNIPAIFPKLGEKRALRLAKNREQLEKKLQDPDIKAQYELNKLLIDFSCIPTDVREGIKKTISI